MTLTTAPTALGRLAHQARLLSGHQRVLRLLVLGCGPLVLYCATAAGATPGRLTWAVIVLLSILAAAQPDSIAPAVTLGGAAGCWALAVPDHTSVWVLPAALLLLVLHSASTLAALGPPGLRLDSATQRRWARRVLAVGALTVSIWAATWLARDVAGPGNLLVTAAALGALAVLLALAV